MRSMSAAESGPVAGMRDPHGGMSVSFKYKRLWSGWPGTTNDSPELPHSDPLAARLRIDVRTAAAPPVTLKRPPVEPLL